LFSTSSAAQVGAILLGGVAGLWFCRGTQPIAAGHIVMPVTRTAGLIALTAFFALLAGLPIVRSLTDSQGIALFEAFYRSGALGDAEWKSVQQCDHTACPFGGRRPRFN
jgi:chromate transporter